MMAGSHTPYPDVNALLDELLRSAEAVLGSQFAGMYLEGSLAGGDFDQDSDIDFVVVTEEEVSGELFAELQAMHDRLAALDSIWAIQLEGSYISRRALRRHDPTLAIHPNIERGRGERLKMAYHDETWDIHRHILRDRGITLAGPAPETLIDLVSPDDLRRAAWAALDGWAAGLLENPSPLQHRGYQSYTVLSVCRILYTLQTGAVASKRVAALWALERLGQPWNALIDRAWSGRRDPDSEASPRDVDGTLAIIRYAVERRKTWKRTNLTSS